MSNAFCPGCGDFLAQVGAAATNPHYEIITVPMSDDPGAHLDLKWHRGCRDSFLRWQQDQGIRP